MATRRNKRLRGGTRKVRFSNNIRSGTNSDFPNNSKYLNELRTRIREHIPEPSVIQANDAEIMAAVLESQETPQEMMNAFRIIYNPEPLTEAEYAIAAPLIKRRGYGKGINVLDSSPLPPAVKDKVLRYVRYARAVRKIEHIFIRGKSNPLFVHEEWGPNKNEKEY